MSEQALRAALLERAKREKQRRQARPVADRFSPEQLAMLEQAQMPDALAQSAAMQSSIDVPSPVAPRPNPIGQAIYENVIGSGAIDTPGEKIGEAISQGGRGLVAGTAGLLDLFTAPARSLKARVEHELSGGDPNVEPEGAGLSAMRGPVTRTVEPVTDVTPETTSAQYARTVGEFLPGTALFGGLSPANLAKFGVAPALASEAAGQATEGTSLEPFARIAGAVAAPSAINVGSRAFKALFQKTSATPTIENLRSLKTQAYRDVDAADVKFTPQQTDDLIARAQRAMDDVNYVPEVDLQSKAALKMLEGQRGKALSLGQLDKLRQGLYTRYNADKSQVGILGIIDEIDNVIQSNTSGGELMAAARLANARFKKAELLDDAFTRAADQTASTGSGGNILNKYRQAVTSIINNPRKARWFSADEIDTMRNFIRGSTPENLLRLGGKLSPSGNGLMAALNLGAVAVDPAMLAVTAGATAAKSLADRSAIQGAQRLQEMLATGQMPAAAQQGGRIGGLLSGLSQ